MYLGDQDLRASNIALKRYSHVLRGARTEVKSLPLRAHLMWTSGAVLPTPIDAWVVHTEDLEAIISAFKTTPILVHVCYASCLDRLNYYAIWPPHIVRAAQEGRAKSMQIGCYMWGATSCNANEIKANQGPIAKS
ncbi:hypothetical protein VNO77_34246 [Canavalia gladiata]|uniref:Uncharacterized protein n=1 Tax=Canavalia gladiata TaxID=3824 RepID=A0AAN9PZM2_CANGL